MLYHYSSYCTYKKISPFLRYLWMTCRTASQLRAAAPPPAASSATATIIQRCDVDVTHAAPCTTQLIHALWLASKSCNARYATSIIQRDHVLQVTDLSQFNACNAVAVICLPGGASAAHVGIYILPAVRAEQ